MTVVGRSRIFAASLVLAGALASSVACVTPHGRVYLRVGPPAPIVEARVAAPGPGYVWIPGYHRWNGGAYVWTPGRWDRPPRVRARWVPSHWAQDRRGWYFVDGRWR